MSFVEYRTGITSITNTTPSTSTATGALVVAGGVGVGEKLYVGGNLFYNSSIYYNGGDTTAGIYGIDEAYYVSNYTEFLLIRTRNGSGIWGYKENNTHGSLLFKTHYNSNTPTTRMTISSSGDVNVANLAGSGNRVVYSDQYGNLTNSSSDSRLKEDVVNLSYGMNEIKTLRPVSFHWIDKSKRGAQKEIGLIAQEVKDIIPEVVGENYDKTYSIDYPKLVSVLIKGMKEQQTVIETQSSQISTLQQTVSTQASQIESLISLQTSLISRIEVLETR